MDVQQIILRPASAAAAEPGTEPMVFSVRNAEKRHDNRIVSIWNRSSKLELLES